MSTTALDESANVPIEPKTDSKPNETIATSTSVVSPMNGVVSPMDGGGLSMDGVCAKESGAAVEEISTAVKRKVEQLQAHAAKKPRVSSPCTLHSGIVRQSFVYDKAMRPLARYNSNSMTTMDHGSANNCVDVLSWESIAVVNALVEDGLLSTASNWELIPDQFKDGLVTTAIEKNPCVLEFFSKQRKNELDHDINAMGSCESEDIWVCNDEVGGLGARSAYLPTSPAYSPTSPAYLPTSPAYLPTLKTKHNRRVSAIRCSIPDEQLQRMEENRPLRKSGYLPAVLVNPCRPAVKRIKTEYNRRVSAIRCSIPDAYHKIKNLNYEIRKLTAPAEISRVRSELNKNKSIILRAQCQMRTAHQEKKTKLEKIKTNAVFRYLTSKDKKVAKVAKFHQWSPFK